MSQMHQHLLAESQLSITAVELQQQAYLGDAKAQYKLADMFQRGKGVKKSAEHAFYWYRQSAQQGNLLAQYNVWYAYLTGEGVTADEKEANRWFAKASVKNASSTDSIITQLIGTGAVLH